MASELAPGFLVAAPALLDPNFHRSVVLLVEHREDGALGFVINRPADLRLADMKDSLGLEIVEATAGSPVLVGGPVAPHTGWVVFEHADPGSLGDDAVKVSDNLGVTASRELLESLASGATEARMLLALGYAGWAPGQLEQEIAQGAWIPVDLDARIVFDTPPEDRWRKTLGLLGIDPARLSQQHSSQN